MTPRWHRVLFGPAAGALMPIDFRYQKRLLLGVYERELWSAYRRLLRKGMKAFDIGGREGYSALLIERLTAAPVISFECEEAASREMQAVFDRNGDNIRAMTAFVGSRANPSTTITLDEAAARFFEPGFVKMDVEGGESDVLEGATQVLARGPGFIIETHSLEQENLCIDTLRRNSYSVEIVDQARFFREQRPAPHNRWLVASRKG